MKNRPKSSRDKKRKSEDKKQLAKIAASEPESTVKREGDRRAFVGCRGEA